MKVTPMNKMHSRLMAAALLCVAPAWAQNDDGDAPEIEGSATVINTRGDESEAPLTRDRATHNVIRGDTLWDLSQKYLGSPWYWPKVWSYNPEIANPHWIFPGNQVRFVQSGEDAPTQVEVGEPSPEPTESPSGEGVTVVGKLGYTPRNSLSLQSTGFVTSKEIEESGRIIGSNGESEMLSFPNSLYIEFASQGRAKMGDVFTIFRNLGPVHHPVTDEIVGYQTKIVGAAKAVKVSPNGVTTMQIVRQFDPVSRGDLIGPSNEALVRRLVPRRNEREVKDAVVVASTTSFLSQFGEHSLIIVDRGSEHGVAEGNTFSVVRQYDPSVLDGTLVPTIVDKRFPEEIIGQCMAFEVKARATTCLMVASIREIVKGDRLEMRTPLQPRTVRR
jgi:LysM domain